MRIGPRQIGQDNSPYLIAELSGEHRGSMSAAERLICAAAEAGFDSVKLQCFRPDHLAEARGGKDKVLTEGIWAGRTLLSLYEETYTPREWFPRLFATAREIGISIFSSVFDEDGVNYLHSLGSPALKVSSFENSRLALIRCAALTGRTVIISAGMANFAELRLAASMCMEGNYAILHCISAYPAPIGEMNLRNGLMRLCYHPARGLSDHTLGSTAAIVATALGASIIEKHITLSREDGGPDASFSLEPSEFAEFVADVKDAYASLGSGERPKSEDAYRSLRVKRD